MVLRVKPIQIRFPISSLYTPMDNTPLHSISCVCRRGSRKLWTVKWLDGHRADDFAIVNALRQELNCSRVAPGYFTLIGDKVPPSPRDINEVACA